MANQVKKAHDRKWFIWLILGTVVMFGFDKVIAPWSQVTEMGVSILGIFLGTMMIVFGTGEAWISGCLCMIALTLCGYYPSADATIAAVIGHKNFYFFLCITAMVGAVVKSGAGDGMARFLLTRKFFQKKPILLTYSFLVAFLIVTNFMNTVGCLMLAYPVIGSFVEQAGMEKNSKYARFMYMGTFIAIALGFTFKGAMMPDTMMRIGFFDSSLESLGISVNKGIYTIYIICTSFIFLLVYVLAMRFLFKCDFSKLANTNFREMPGMLEGAHFTKKQTILLSSFVLFILYAFVPKSWTILNQIGIVHWTAILCIILSLIQIKNENGEKEMVFNFIDGLKGTPWNVLMTVALFAVLGSALGKSDLGIAGWVQELTAPVLERTGGAFMVAIAVILTAAITQFFSNTATATIFASITAAVCVPFVKNGMNPALICGAILLAAQSGFMTFAASGTAGIYLTHETTENKFVYTYGLATVGLFALTDFLCFLLFNLFV